MGVRLEERDISQGRPATVGAAERESTSRRDLVGRPIERHVLRTPCGISTVRLDR